MWKIKIQLLPASSPVKPFPFQEALLGWLVTLTRTFGFIERLVPRACPGAHTLTALLVEDMVWRAGGTGQRVANALAGIQVEVVVGAAVVSRNVALTHALTGFHIEFFIWATNICREHVWREGRATVRSGIESFGDSGRRKNRTIPV